jgi:hypothetical protein
MVVAVAMADAGEHPAVRHPTHEATKAQNVVLDIPALGGRVVLGAQMARPMREEGVGHAEPKRRRLIQEAFPVVRGGVDVV